MVAFRQEGPRGEITMAPPSRDALGKTRPGTVWDHRSLIGTAGLLPAAAGEGIKLVPSERRLRTVELEVNKQGGHVKHLDWGSIPSLYSDNAPGRPRLADNTDTVEFPNVYMKEMDDVYGAWRDFPALKDWALEEAKKVHPLLHQGEEEDGKKLTMQQFKAAYPGYMIETLGDDGMLVELPSEWHRAMAFVAETLAERAGPALKWDLMRCMTDDKSPVNKNIGLPSMASGDHARIMRVDTALSLPKVDFDRSAGDWLEDLALWARQLDLPPELAYACPISRRKGPTRKPIPLWILTGDDAYSFWDSVGAYPRERLVYMVNFYFNAIETLIAIPAKVATEKTSGLNHRPGVSDGYVEQMRRNGGRVFEGDWSAMDRNLGPAHKKGIWEAMKSAGFNEFACEMLIELEDLQGVFYPHWMAGGAGTLVTGPHGLQSGHRVTSLTDTLANLAAILSGLAVQLGWKVLELWKQGLLGIAILGDDLIFSLPKGLDAQFDPEALSAWVKQLGGKLTLREGLVFLKKFLPLGPFAKLPVGTRFGVLCRMIQQTIWNENPSDDQVIFRLGYSTREDHSRHSPLASRFLPAMEHLTRKYVRAARVAPRLLPGDDKLIVAYATRSKGFLEDLIEKMEYLPSRHDTARMIEGLGLDIAQMAAPGFSESKHVKQETCKALLAPSDPHAVARVKHYTKKRQLLAA